MEALGFLEVVVFDLVDFGKVHSDFVEVMDGYILLVEFEDFGNGVVYSLLGLEGK